MSFSIALLQRAQHLRSWCGESRIGLSELGLRQLPGDIQAVCSPVKETFLNSRWGRVCKPKETLLLTGARKWPGGRYFVRDDGCQSTKMR